MVPRDACLARAWAAGLLIHAAALAALLGICGGAAAYADPYRVLVATLVLAAGGAEAWAAQARGVGTIVARQSSAVPEQLTGAMLLVVVCLAFAYPGSHDGLWATMQAGLGIGTLAAGAALRCASIVALGPLFLSTPGIVAGHRLILRGPYRVQRHPSEAGLLLIAGGVGATAGSLPAAAAGALLWALVLWRIHREERLLYSRFGVGYRRYAARTPGLVPRAISCAPPCTYS